MRSIDFLRTLQKAKAHAAEGVGSDNKAAVQPPRARRPGSISDESEFDFRVDPAQYAATKDYDVSMTEIATGLNASSGTSLPNDIAHGDCLL